MLVEQKERFNNYESINEVGLNNVGSEAAASVEIATNEQDQSVIENLVREELKRRCWWLQEYWQEKGMPKEQVDIKIGEHTISLYNFGEMLQEKHYQQLQKLIEDLQKFDGGKLLQRPQYILLDDVSILNPNTDVERRGDAGIDDRAIKIHPKGVQFDDYRAEETSNFSGTSDFEASVIHEFGHGVSVDVINEWREKFGWRLLRENKFLSGGSFTIYEPSKPDHCISQYAQINPDEDICESIVAALRNPNNLDPDKLQFIKENLMSDSEAMPIEFQKKEASEVVLPRIESVNYKVIAPTFKLKRKKPQ